MRTPILCNSYGCDTQLGWHYSATWNEYGGDPPEDDLWDGPFVLNDEYYCFSCYDELKAEAKEAEAEVEAETRRIYERECTENDSL